MVIAFSHSNGYIVVYPYTTNVRIYSQKFMTYPRDPICSNLSSISIMSRPTKQDLKRCWSTTRWPGGMDVLGTNRPEPMGFYNGVLPSNVGAPYEFPAIERCWKHQYLIADWAADRYARQLAISRVEHLENTRETTNQTSHWCEWMDWMETSGGNCCQNPSLGTRNTEESRPRARIIQKISETKNPANK
jgi:hypothetical protein